MRFIIYTILLSISLFAFTLNTAQMNNAKYIYSKTTNKDYAKFLITLAMKETSLNHNAIHKCDLKYKGKCYDSIGLFQINMHTAKRMYPNIPIKVLRKKLKTRFFSLKVTKRLLQLNSVGVSRIYKKDISNISSRYIFKQLQVYNGGFRNKKKAYAKKFLRIYKQIKRMNFD